MKTLLLTAVVLAAAAIAAPPLDGWGQAASPEQAAPARFEVASIKRNTSGQTFVTFSTQPERLNLTNVAVRELIVRAYQVQPFQVSGGPSWVASDRFDVSAKAPGPAVTPAQTNAMLQALLADRFKLVVHKEERPGDIFRLVKARADGRLGDGLKPAGVDCASRRGGPPGLGGPLPVPGGRAVGPGPGPANVAVPGPGGAPGPGGGPGGCLMMIGPGRVEMGGQPLASLANALARQLARPVRDETGLAGAYDLTLTFLPDSAGRGMPIGPLPPGAPELPPIDPNAPSLTTALVEQLGLKLEATRGPMEMIVIDRIEQPTED